MSATLPWERYDAVMTPCVIELENDVLRMYYSGGESYEPDAIGVAHSYDGGVTWVKHGDPIFYPDPLSLDDNYKVRRFLGGEEYFWLGRILIVGYFTACYFS